MSESLVEENKFLREKLSEVGMKLDVAEAALAVANDSLGEARLALPAVRQEGFDAGFHKGRLGFGAFLGWDAFHNDPCGGVGVVFRF
jgi:hypothetical protein